MSEPEVPPVVIPDAFSILADLATCLCAQIAEADLPEPCFCGIFPGAAASDQYMGGDKDGMAWVRLAGAYPANAAAQPATEPGNCTQGLGFDIEVGILRCTPVGDDSGNPPLPEELYAAAQLQIADMYAMRAAILCCDSIPNRDALLTTYEPVGPEGAGVGGTWVVSVVI